MTLELGGNDPAIVLPDVDPAEAAPAIFRRAPNTLDGFRAFLEEGVSLHLDPGRGERNVTDLALLDQKSGPPGEAGGRCSWGCTM